MDLRRAIPHGTVGWLMAATVLIAGLVAMHALSGVAAVCPATPAHSASTHHHDQPSPPSTPQHPAGPVATGFDQQATAGHADAESHCTGQGHLGAMCLAILLGLGVLAVLTRRRARDLAAGNASPSQPILARARPPRRREPIFLTLRVLRL